MAHHQAHPLTVSSLPRLGVLAVFFGLASVSFSTSPAGSPGPLSGVPVQSAAAPTQVRAAHVAETGSVRVSALWRSERATDGYAKEALRIADAVVTAVRQDSPTEPARAQIGLGLAPSPAALRALRDGEKAGKKRRRRKQGKAEAVEATGAPLVVPAREEIQPAGAVVAVVPKMADRVMFLTGLPPATRWATALEAARAATGSDAVGADLLGPAVVGMGKAGFAQALVAEPYTSTTLVTLQTTLALMPADERAAALTAMASEPYSAEQMFTAKEASVAPLSLLARHLGAQHSVDELLALEPEWFQESGASGHHPEGLQVVATRNVDALVLRTEPMGHDRFTLRTSVVVLSNDAKTPGQADLVLGDKGGDRYLLAMNSVEGVYLFRRPGPNAPYEAIAEMKEIKIPIAQRFEVEVRWDDGTVVITVGGVEMAGQVLPADGMAGGYGVGAHAGSTAVFGPLDVE